MIYNDLQESILAVLGRADRSPEEALRPIIEEHYAEPDLYSRLMAALLNTEMDEAEARIRYTELINHHKELETSAGRRLDFRVAAMDYLVVHREIIGAPTIVDQTMLQLTQRLAAIDEVTGLFNRRFLETYLTKELNRAKRYGQVFSVLFLDLDDFKKINDSHGHAVGDDVLSGLGRQITDLLRHEDIAARYGGEEFTVVLPQTTARGAAVFGERLRSAVAGLDLVPGRTVTFSAGVATYPRHGVTVDELMRQADAALYQAKLEGKDRIIISNAEKRASTRYFADFPAVAYMGTARIGPLRLCDVSESGCALESDDMLKPGQMLRVRVFSNESGEPKEHDVLAHIVWSRKVSDKGAYRGGGRWEAAHSEEVEAIVKSASAKAAG